MRKIEDVLRLHAQGMSTRRIALATGVGKTTVIEYLRHVANGWPVLAAARGLDEVALERRVFPPPPPSQGRQLAAAAQSAIRTASAPSGSRFKGYQTILVRDLSISAELIRYRRERWLTLYHPFSAIAYHPSLACLLRVQN